MRQCPITTTREDHHMTTLDMLHAENCRSLLRIGLYHARNHDWDRAIDVLKAAIRAANRGHLLRTAGLTLVAIRRCQDARKHYEAMAPVPSMVA